MTLQGQQVQTGDPETKGSGQANITVNNDRAMDIYNFMSNHPQVKVSDFDTFKNKYLSDDRSAVKVMHDLRRLGGGESMPWIGNATEFLDSLHTQQTAPNPDAVQQPAPQQEQSNQSQRGGERGEMIRRNQQPEQAPIPEIPSTQLSPEDAAVIAENPQAEPDFSKVEVGQSQTGAMHQGQKKLSDAENEILAGAKQLVSNLGPMDELIKKPVSDEGRKQLGTKKDVLQSASVEPIDKAKQIRDQYQKDIEKKMWADGTAPYTAPGSRAELTQILKRDLGMNDATAYARAGQIQEKAAKIDRAKKAYAYQPEDNRLIDYDWNADRKFAEEEGGDGTVRMKRGNDDYHKTIVTNYVEFLKKTNDESYERISDRMSYMDNPFTRSGNVSDDKFRLELYRDAYKHSKMLLSGRMEVLKSKYDWEGYSAVVDRMNDTVREVDELVSSLSKTGIEKGSPEEQELQALQTKFQTDKLQIDKYGIPPSALKEISSLIDGLNGLEQKSLDFGKHLSTEFPNLYMEMQESIEAQKWQDRNYALARVKAVSPSPIDKAEGMAVVAWENIARPFTKVLRDSFGEGLIKLPAITASALGGDGYNFVDQVYDWADSYNNLYWEGPTDLQGQMFPQNETTVRRNFKNLIDQAAPEEVAAFFNSKINEAKSKEELMRLAERSSYYIGEEAANTLSHNIDLSDKNVNWASMPSKISEGAAQLFSFAAAGSAFGQSGIIAQAFNMELDGQYKSALEAGMNSGDAARSASLISMVIGVSELIVRDDMIFDKMKKELTRKVYSDFTNGVMFKDALLRNTKLVMQTAAKEGVLEEGGQYLLELYMKDGINAVMGEDFYSNTEFDTREFFEAVTIGAIMGGGMVSGQLHSAHTMNKHALWNAVMDPEATVKMAENQGVSAEKIAELKSDLNAYAEIAKRIPENAPPHLAAELLAVYSDMQDQGILEQYDQSKQEDKSVDQTDEAATEEPATDQNDKTVRSPNEEINKKADALLDKINEAEEQEPTQAEQLTETATVIELLIAKSTGTELTEEQEDMVAQSSLRFKPGEIGAAPVKESDMNETETALNSTIEAYRLNENRSKSGSEAKSLDKALKDSGIQMDEDQLQQLRDRLGVGKTPKTLGAIIKAAARKGKKGSDVISIIRSVSITDKVEGTVSNEVGASESAVELTAEEIQAQKEAKKKESNTQELEAIRSSFEVEDKADEQKQYSKTFPSKKDTPKSLRKQGEENADGTFEVTLFGDELNSVMDKLDSKKETKKKEKPNKKVTQEVIEDEDVSQDPAETVRVIDLTQADEERNNKKREARREAFTKLAESINESEGTQAGQVDMAVISAIADLIDAAERATTKAERVAAAKQASDLIREQLPYETSFDENGDIQKKKVTAGKRLDLAGKLRNAVNSVRSIDKKSKKEVPYDPDLAEIEGQMWVDEAFDDAYELGSDLNSGVNMVTAVKIAGKLLRGIGMIAKARGIRTFAQLQSELPDHHQAIVELAAEYSVNSTDVFNFLKNPTPRVGKTNADQDAMWRYFLANLSTEMQGKTVDEVNEYIQQMALVYGMASLTKKNGVRNKQGVVVNTGPVARMIMNLSTKAAGMKNINDLTSYIESELFKGTEKVKKQIADGKRNKTKKQQTSFAYMFNEKFAEKQNTIDAIKADLISFISDNLDPATVPWLNKTQYMSIMRTIRSTKTDKGLGRAIEKVRGIVEVADAKRTGAHLRKLLDKDYTSIPKGSRVRKGKLSTSAQKRMASIRNNSELPITEVNQKIDDILDEASSQNRSLTNEEIETIMDLDVAAAIINASGLPASAQTASNNHIIDYLTALVTNGRLEHKDDIAAQAAIYQVNLEKSIKDISVDKKGKNASSNAAIKKGQKIAEGTRKLLQYGIYRSEDIRGLVESMSWNNGFLKELITDNLFHARRDFEAKQLKFKNEVREAAESIFGKKWESTFRSMRNQYIVLPNVKKVRDGGAPLQLNQQQAYFQWNQYKDLTQRKNQMATFEIEQTDEVLAEAELQAIMDHIERNLDPRMKMWAEWQMEYAYPMIYDIVSPAYEDMFRTPLPRVENFAGHARKEGFNSAEDMNLFNNIGWFNPGINAAGIKSRVASNLELQLQDGNDALMTYATDMLHFAAHARTVKNIDAVLENSKFKAVAVRDGKAIQLEVLKDMMKVVKSRGVSIHKGVDTFDMLSKLQVVGALGLAISVLPKQMISGLIAAGQTPDGFSIMDYYVTAAKMGVASIANTATLGQIDSVSKEGFRGNWKMAVDNSPYLQKRYDSQEMMMALVAVGDSYNQQITSKDAVDMAVHRVVQATMKPIKWGDALGVSGGLPIFKMVYDAEIKRTGMHDSALEKATIALEKATSKVQQSASVLDRDFWQTGSAFRYLNMYSTAPRAQYRESIHALRNINKQFHGKPHEGNFGKNAYQYMMVRFVVPGIFTYVGSGLPGLLTEWDDDDDKDEMIWGVSLGNMTGLFIVGGILQATSEIMQGKSYADFKLSPIEDHVFHAIRDVYGAFSDKSRRENDGNPDYLTMLREVFNFTGLPLNNLEKLFRNYYDLLNGDVDSVEETVLKIFNYSDRVIEETKGKKKSSGGVVTGNTVSGSVISGGTVTKNN